MPDWPLAQGCHKPTISSHSGEAAGIAGAVPGSATWPLANRAIYVPFVLVSAFAVKRLWWANGSAVAGNVDCGVYTADGTLLTNAGSTAQAGTSVIQSVTLGTVFLLYPGSYYMALAASSASATFMRSTAIGGSAVDLQLLGMAQQALGALPLPATFTLASVGSSYLPLFGITGASVI